MIGTRAFDAPRDLVFRGVSDPAHPGRATDASAASNRYAFSVYRT